MPSLAGSGSPIDRAAQEGLATSIVRNLQTKLRERGLNTPAPPEPTPPGAHGTVVATLPAGSTAVQTASPGDSMPGLPEAASEPATASPPVTGPRGNLTPAAEVPNRIGPQETRRTKEGTPPSTQSSSSTAVASPLARSGRPGKFPLVPVGNTGSPARPDHPAPPPPRDPGGALSAGFGGAPILLFNALMATLMALVAYGAFRAPTVRSASPSDRLIPAPFVPRLERPG